MKTLIIYNPMDRPLSYCILKGDYSELNNCLINSGTNEEQQQKAIDLLFRPDSGEYKIELSDDISFVENKEWDKVAVITFLP